MDDLGLIDAGGVRLSCRAAGDPSAPPLVLLHALAEDGSDWAEEFRAALDAFLG